jgi:transposase
MVPRSRNGVVMVRSKNGEAISATGRSPAAVKKLEEFVLDRKKSGNLEEWRRGRAIWGYIAGRRVMLLAVELDVTRGSVNRWLQWYETDGLNGLVTLKPPGPPRKLSDEQRQELTALIENGPLVAGYQSGVWTGPMVGDLIESRFGVSYHKHNVPVILHELGFSLQRPRKRLARGDVEAQATWVLKTLPAIKK